MTTTSEPEALSVSRNEHGLVAIECDTPPWRILLRDVQVRQLMNDLSTVVEIPPTVTSRVEVLERRADVFRYVLIFVLALGSGLYLGTL